MEFTAMALGVLSPNARAKLAPANFQGQGVNRNPRQLAPPHVLSARDLGVVRSNTTSPRYEAPMPPPPQSHRSPQPTAPAGREQPHAGSRIRGIRRNSPMRVRRLPQLCCRVPPGDSVQLATTAQLRRPNPPTPHHFSDRDA